MGARFVGGPSQGTVEGTVGQPADPADVDRAGRMKDLRIWGERGRGWWRWVARSVYRDTGLRDDRGRRIFVYMGRDREA